MERRPCWVEIDTRAFEDNYRLLAAASNDAAEDAARLELLAIVKANAYGHGLELCAPAAVRAGARWLGVTSVEEGVAARRCAADAKILVIGGPFAGQGAEVIAHRLTAVMWEHWQLDELEAAAQRAGCEAGSVAVHLELDTGMNRQGVGRDELDGIVARLLGESAADSPLSLGGLMTHLYAADERDDVATREQMIELERLVARVMAAVDGGSERGRRDPIWLHVGNSAAVLKGDALRALRDICGRWGLRPMARPGLALYGLIPEFTDGFGVDERGGFESLRPVLTWKTQMVSVRSIDAGQVVGYNGTFVATEPMRLALLAVGYADGLNRALSNRGWVLIRGERAPIVGRISMDQTVVDVTGIAGVGPMDEVVLLGRQRAETITVEDHARWAWTIPWEIFTSIGARVERREVRSGP
jgi:alanine racemase